MIDGLICMNLVRDVLTLAAVANRSVPVWKCAVARRAIIGDLGGSRAVDSVGDGTLHLIRKGLPSRANMVRYAAATGVHGGARDGGAGIGQIYLAWIVSDQLLGERIHEESQNCQKRSYCSRDRPWRD